MSSSMLDWFLSTLTPTADSHVPSTAEIIQKCLSVNPFDLKFREANMQISQTQEQLEQNGLVPPTVGLPTTAGITMLKLPSSLSQSPGIFSNISVLSADLEGELRKTIDLSRKVQQLRESGAFNKGEGNRTPCTADVLNAVLDMNMNQMGGAGSSLSIPSTSSLVASLSAVVNAATACATSTATVPSSVAVSAGTSAALASSGAGFAPVAGSPTNSLRRVGTPNTDQSAATSLLHSQPMIQPLSISTPTSSVQNTSALAPPSVTLGSANSPASSVQSISPRSTSTLAEIKKTPSSVDLLTGPNASLLNHSVSSVASAPDQWDNDVKPAINKRMTEPMLLNPLSSAQSFYHSDESNLTNLDMHSSALPRPEPQRNGEKPPRKYARYNSNNSSGASSGTDNQVSSTQRGGRGRRSLTSEMPADERRSTILERNKAAAVRYRKRKKEEHDDMIGRVHTLEQEKVALATQNSVLRRELERLTELLKARDRQCICRASQIGVNSLLGDHRADSPMGLDALGNGGQHTTTSMDHVNFMAQLRASSQSLRQ